MHKNGSKIRHVLLSRVETWAKAFPSKEVGRSPLTYSNVENPCVDTSRNSFVLKNHDDQHYNHSGHFHVLLVKKKTDARAKK